MKPYPDISHLLERKAQRRLDLAKLPFEEKIAIVEKWRNLSQRIRRLRKARPAAAALKRTER